MKRRRLEVELGQEHFCPTAERFRRGNFPPGGGNHRHHHHQTTLPSLRGPYPSTSSTTPTTLKP